MLSSVLLAIVEVCLPEPLMEQILHRVPSVHNAEPWKLVNGPEAFTPDGRCIMGEAPEVSSRRLSFLFKYGCEKWGTRCIW